ncbi:hypothetical protein NDU88_011693 [Pleurodeles waltl]|uniref:Uncharacterized protein n=1 Tax=Pleurodeles waltl TaxID=8319 RepID=A0AAV7R237_PLEWA|nr:hypothetical protein NDU88_011693 [Pleurodeles waltl]
MDGVRVLTSTGPLRPLSRGPQQQQAHCFVTAAILGCGSHKVFGRSFPGDPCSRDAAVPTCALYSPIASLQSPRPPVVTMAGFKLRAWTVAQGRHTMPHSLMFRFVLLLSPFVVKVSEPFVPSNEWCGGPHLYGTFVSSQPRAAAATGSLLCRGRHFGSRQPRSCRGEFSG